MHDVSSCLPLDRSSGCLSDEQVTRNITAMRDTDPPPRFDEDLLDAADAHEPAGLTYLEQQLFSDREDV